MNLNRNTIHHHVYDYYTACGDSLGFGCLV